MWTSLHTDNHTSTSLLNFFTSQMLFLMPNQQCQKCWRQNLGQLFVTKCLLLRLQQLPRSCTYTHTTCTYMHALCINFLTYRLKYVYHHHNCFTALFLGPPGWAGARRELLDFMLQGKTNRGRHTDHPAGRHSIRTNQCPPPPCAMLAWISSVGMYSSLNFCPCSLWSKHVLPTFLSPLMTIFTAKKHTTPYSLINNWLNVQELQSNMQQNGQGYHRVFISVNL